LGVAVDHLLLTESDLLAVLGAVVKLQNGDCGKSPAVTRVALVSYWLHAEVFAPVNLHSYSIYTVATK